MINKLEDEFILKLIDFQYNQTKNEEIKALAQIIPWAKGWPDNKQAFWNVETYLWQRKIPKKVKEQIKNELNNIKNIHSKTNTTPKILDLGCGAYSYIDSHTGIDFSPRMLKFNDNIENKIKFDLNKTNNSNNKIPIKDNEFNIITAIFLLNYLNNPNNLLQEAKRILKANGTLVTVLSKTGVSPLHQTQEIQKYTKEQWLNTIKNLFPNTTIKIISNLYIFVSQK